MGILVRFSRLGFVPRLQLLEDCISTHSKRKEQVQDGICSFFLFSNCREALSSQPRPSLILSISCTLAKKQLS